MIVLLSPNNALNFGNLNHSTLSTKLVVFKNGLNSDHLQSQHEMKHQSRD